MSCSGAFDIHPYDVNIKGETGINAKQMAIIEKQFASDLYIRSMFQDSSIPLKDILGLSIGLKFYTL